MKKNCLLVTGGTYGSGREIAERFARGNYEIVLTSREQSRAGKAAAEISGLFGIRTIGVELNPGNEDDTVRMFSELDRKEFFPATLVLNAANLGMGMDFFNASSNDFSEVINTNLVGAFLICREAAKRMRQYGGGSIVLVGTNTATRAIRNRCAYIASKGGLASLSKSMAVELGRYGIRVNCLVPGALKSERWEGQTEERRETIRKRSLLGDIADNTDLAEAAWFLGTNLSKSITGTELLLDNGASAQLVPES